MLPKQLLFVEINKNIFRFLISWLYLFQTTQCTLSIFVMSRRVIVLQISQPSSKVTSYGESDPFSSIFLIESIRGSLAGIFEEVPCRGYPQIHTMDDHDLVLKHGDDWGTPHDQSSKWGLSDPHFSCLMNHL